DALCKRRRLHITYHSRSRNQTTRRTVSPQRLAHYRDNWYLDAWDHGKAALRSFALERIKQSKDLKVKAKDIPDRRLDDYFSSAYGIFAGRPRHTAVLRFSPERSRWVAEETWHPKQKGHFERGCYILEVPYSDPRELSMDILKHGPHVDVQGPPALRAEIRELAARTFRQYAPGRDRQGMSGRARPRMKNISPGSRNETRDV
ncbi:MAG: WYL domain-containing protein, partial [Syntrophaceae bacterium]|nr:WYL domain-containing protein [Syntrophaceae bacterium]